MQAAPVVVLLVEDNPGDVKLLQRMLAEAKSAPFTLECVERLSAALARLAKGDVGLVLLDLSLPDSQGLATFAKAHSQAHHVPIIVLSGLDDEALALRTVQEGAQDYLLKGHVDSHLLVRAMRYAIERKRSEEELARYAAELRDKNVQMEASLQMASEIQRALLPHQYPTIPRHAAPAESALRFCHSYRPSGAVGGDFFDVLALSDTQAGVFICDVMGRGVRAALVTAMVRTLTAQLRHVALDAGKFLTEINRHLLAIMGQTRMPVFLSAFYLVADVASGEMGYANAGHPSPLRVRREAREVNRLPLVGGVPGPPLGLMDEVYYPAGYSKLAGHDLIVLFTDGLYDVAGEGGEAYGEERLLEAVRGRIGLPPADLFDELLAEIQAFAADKRFDDDVCLLGMEVARVGKQ